MQLYGIDLSKEKFDVNYFDSNNKQVNKIFKNNLSSISTFLSEVPSGSILCAEYTGVYGDLLLYLCNHAKITLCLISGYNIKHSLGLQKGKSDQTDARRIREYAERFSDKLVASVYVSQEMKELQELHTLREQLVKVRKGLSTSLLGSKSLPMQSICAHRQAQSVIDVITEKIAETDKEIETVIQSNQELNQNYQLAKSVKGVGPVIATDLLIKTGNFKTIDSASKAASYAGVCPFPNSSGKRIAKTKTSPFADKKLKTLLHMGARAAVKHNKEFNLYYQRKKMEGKPHFLIMNNIANKMLRTIYSVVKCRNPWQQSYICNDPREKFNSSC